MSNYGDGGGTLEFTSTKSKKASLEFPKVAKEPSSDFGRLNGFVHECINLLYCKKIVSRFWIKIENNIHFTRNILVVLTLTPSDVDVNLIMIG